MIRKNAKLEEASWKEALDFAVSRLKGIRAKHGEDSVVFFSSARRSNEDNFWLKKRERAYRKSTVKE
jgi:formate dehydrogenase major subunit